ncbi:DUF6029 family protein [bacterium]|nr:DUF6029 family protein [bacterium]
MKKVGFLVAFVTFSFISNCLFAQITNNLNLGSIHGNFESTNQYYNIDTIIGAPIVDEKLLSNNFMNVIFNKGNFTAGVRLEGYLNVLQGFDPNYKGFGIPYRYVGYTLDGLDVTVGNFYEQFGSGMILRSYEERALGIDNAFEGARLKYSPAKGLYLKGLIGRQRLFFTTSPGIVRGIDGELVLNEISAMLDTAKTRITIGGSFVSKYQEDKDPVYNLPENVASFAGRFNIARNGLSLMGEYVYKMNDPSADNYFIYKPGQALFLTLAYSQKGIGSSFTLKSIDNMSFRSDRTQSLTNLMINYLPATTRQHTYNLAATLYPYNTQPTGEVGLQWDLIGKLKKKTWYGGKYGTLIALNYSLAHGLDTTQYNQISDPDSTRMAYTTNYFALGEQKYFQDINIEITRKINKKLKIKASYINLFYNMEIVQGLGGRDNIKANIAVLDVLYKIKPKHAIRVEAQGLWTEQDQGDWATGVIEYTFSPHWFIAIMDQYNYGNSDVSYRLHYPIASLGFNKSGNRFMMSYGRQRAGIFCVGGVCRNVPASNGFTLSITSSF